MKIINNNISNYYSYNTKNTIDNKFSNSVKNEDLIKTNKKVNKSLDCVGANAPKAVQEAWEKALEETGVDDFGRNEEGMHTHITQMMIMQIMLVKGTGSSDVLGNSVSSAIKATKQALHMLNNQIEPSRDSGKINLEAKEREFYEAFLKHLNQIY